jgi:cytochrome c oxidase cbb3-type subunit 3
MAEQKRVDPIQGEIIHEYDGILEADNRLPLWWLWTFYAAIIFSIGYWFYYEEFEAAPGLQAAYLSDKAKQAAESGKDPTDAELLAQVGTPAAGKGKETFIAMCAACHESGGQGKIGPNLTDSAWLHGGDPVSIYRSIRDGVPAKGMPAWGATLGPLGVQEITAFVLSIKDTNVPGKAPEGTVGETPKPSEATEPVEDAGVQEQGATVL